MEIDRHRSRRDHLIPDPAAVKAVSYPCLAVAAFLVCGGLTPAFAKSKTGNTKKLVEIPTQSYAMIDPSAGVTASAVERMAFDDDGHVAFSYWEGATHKVALWQNGSLVAGSPKATGSIIATTAHTYAIDAPSLIGSGAICLNIHGDLFQEGLQIDPSPPHGEIISLAGYWPYGTNQVNSLLNSLLTVPWDSARAQALAADGSVLIGTGPGGPVSGIVSLTSSGAATVLLGFESPNSGLGYLLTSSSSSGICGVETYDSSGTVTGHRLVGTAISPTTVTVSGRIAAVNDEQDLLIDGVYNPATGRTEGAALMESGGIEQHFLSTGTDTGLIPWALQAQVRNIEPLLLSNRNESAAGKEAVYYVILRAETQRSATSNQWELTEFLLRKLADGSFDFKEIAGGAFLSPTYINKYGVIASYGDLLFPIDLEDTNEQKKLSNWILGVSPMEDSIAWIEPHADSIHPDPKMPYLIFCLHGLPSGCTLKAKMEVDYTRGNGNKDHETQDLVKIPLDGTLKTSAAGEIDFGTDYSALPFFGGKGKIYFQINGTDGALTPLQTFSFIIGGKNPDNDRCRAFIESQPDAGPSGNIWYSYAISKHEMAEYRENNSPHFYNQFINDKRSFWKKWLVGSPTWNDDGSGPGGYGLFSVTGTASDPVAVIPREQIWNWQEGAKAGLTIIRDKRTATSSWMTSQKSAAGGVTLPFLLVNGVTFAESSPPTMDHAIAIKAYNGRRNVPAGWVDPLPAPLGFSINNYFNVNYCAWKASSGWVLNRWKQPLNPETPPINYINLVTLQVEN